MRILHIYISPKHNFVGHHGMPAGEEPMQDVAEVECVAGLGLQGDRYFGHRDNYKGQITFFSQEVYEGLCEKFDQQDRDASVFRRNVIVSDVDLNALIGKEFEVQGITFKGTEEAKPCYWMNQAFCEGAEQALMGHGGLRARILTDGVLRRDG
ncbi:MAG: MOSC domain-containing protein [Verrucomicrobium sp.]